MSRSLYDKLYRRFGETLSDTELNARINKLLENERARLLASSFSPECQSRLKSIRVAIVGGGFAGMMAAWSLCQKANGIEVVVFEARAEVGGRVRSDEKFTKGRIIDFGAELVGANHPTWLTLARELGIGLMTRTGDDHYDLFGLKMKINIDGKDINPDQARALKLEMEKIFKKIGKEARQIGDPAAPWLTPPPPPPAMGNKDFDQMSVYDKLTKAPPGGFGLKKGMLVLRAIELLLGNNLLTPLEKINYLGLLCLVKAGRLGNDKDNTDPDLLGFWQHTEDFRCTDGCQALVKNMVARLTEKRRDKKYTFTLLTETPVRVIKIDPINVRPVTLTWDRSAAAEKLKPNPNFDYVILATPPSVWDDIKITPEHPTHTIGQPQMGPAVKFFSNLKDRFWIAENAAPSGISSEIGMIWEGTDNQTLVKVRSPGLCGQEIELSVFAGGLAKTGRVLKEPQFTKELKRLYLGYDESNRGSNSAEKTKLVNWPEEDFIKTGYSCPKVGHMFTIAPELQKPLNNGRLFLAGEHTQTDFFGFMEGALRSGQRAAKAVIAKVCPETEERWA